MNGRIEDVVIVLLVLSKLVMLALSIVFLPNLNYDCNDIETSTTGEHNKKLVQRNSFTIIFKICVIKDLSP